MKQDELFFWLKKQYELGDFRFWSVHDLEACFCKEDFYNIRTLLVKLYAFGYLDIEITDLRRYRVKKKYVNVDVIVKSPLAGNLTYDEFCKLFKEE